MRSNLTHGFGFYPLPGPFEGGWGCPEAGRQRGLLLSVDGSVLDDASVPWSTLLA